MNHLEIASPIIPGDVRMESRGESELQQLVSSDPENDDSIVQEDTIPEEKVISPVRSSKAVNILKMFRINRDF